VIVLNEFDFNELRKFENSGFVNKNNVLESYQERSFFKDVNIKDILHPDDEYLESLISRKVEMVTLQLTQRCNLRCTYCFYSGRYGNREHSDLDISFDIATKALDYAFSRSIDAEALSVGFYGGEPLLMIDLIKDCVSYIEEHYNGRRVQYNITTNGTLLTKNVYKYLKDKDFSILVSIDGPKPIHDSNRKFKNGTGSYDRIIKNLASIEEFDSESVRRIGINAVIGSNRNDLCGDQIFSIEEFNNYSALTLAFLSDTYIDEPYSYNNLLSVAHEKEVCKLLLFLAGRISKSHVFKFILSYIDIYNREYRRIRRIENFPEVVHHSGPCVPGASRLLINIFGDIFPCERVSELSLPMKLGTLDSGIDISKARKILSPGRLIKEHCKNCWMILHCMSCAAHYDTLTELSAPKAISKCEGNQQQYEYLLKIICFLKKNKYDFMLSEVSL